MAEKNEGQSAVQERGANGPSTPASTRESGSSPQVRGGSNVPAMPHMFSPFTFMKRFAEDMDRLFEDYEINHGLGVPRLLSRGREMLRREAGMVPADWSPKVDVKERDGKFIVRADLPGMSRDDLKVDVRDGVLTIQGDAGRRPRRRTRAGITASAATGISSGRSPCPTASTPRRPRRTSATVCSRSRSPPRKPRGRRPIASPSVPELRVTTQGKRP